jgi:hypothetical protein
MLLLYKKMTISNPLFSSQKNWSIFYEILVEIKAWGWRKWLFVIPKSQKYRFD